jgi:hypothetical protein
MTHQETLIRPDVRSNHEPRFAPTIGADDDIHPLRRRGPKYPPHNASSPILEGIDIAGLVAGAVITLGPLAAYAFGMGA